MTRHRHPDTPASAALPLVVLRPQRHGRCTVTVNGHPAGDPVRTAELGHVLARIAERAAGPVRVEIHQPDGTIHIDTITPPRRPDAARSTEPRPDRQPVSAAGFLPGEQVHLALVVATLTASPDGRIAAKLPRRLRRHPGPLLAVGIQSSTTTVHQTKR